MNLLANDAPILPRIHGSTEHNVLSYGAINTGDSECSDAFNAAIDSLPSEGGVVVVPPGTYLINPEKSVRLRSRMKLVLSEGATLLSTPTAADKTSIIRAYNIEHAHVVGYGATLIGERERHLVTTGEWAMGIQLYATRHFTVEGLAMREFWGDGMSMGATAIDGELVYSDDVVIQKIHVNLARRNGLSIGRSTNVIVLDSTFENTYGTSPECGIDVEPDLPDSGGYAENILIKRCKLLGNAKWGINVFKSARRVQMVDNDISGNVNGIVAVGAVDLEIFGNRIWGQKATGIHLKTTSARIHVAENECWGNYTRLAPQERVPTQIFGWTKAIERDLLIASTVVDARIGRNYYR